jgi:alpha-mannosidase
VAAGLFQVHVDRPTLYEAWDIDPHYARTAEDVTGVEAVELVGDQVRVTRTYRSSTLTQTIGLRPGVGAVDFRFDIDWHEQRRLVKFALPLDLATDRAASEIQFGHVYRSTHANTSWDQARYETVAHRWVHVAEPGYGVGVVNDSTYGHDISRRHLDVADTTGTTVRLSLVRGPMFPDPNTDQGEHTMNVSLVVGADLETARREGWRINEPVRQVTGGSPVAPLVAVDGAGVVVQTVKAAEDGSGDVVVRLYEADGARAKARVRADFAYDRVEITDLLEEPVDGPELDTTEGVALTLRPFQIVTLRFRRS